MSTKVGVTVVLLLFVVWLFWPAGNQEDARRGVAVSVVDRGTCCYGSCRSPVRCGALCGTHHSRAACAARIHER